LKHLERDEVLLHLATQRVPQTFNLDAAPLRQVTCDCTVPQVTPLDERRRPPRGKLFGIIAVNGEARSDEAVETVIVARERALACRDVGSKIVEKGPRSEPDDGSHPLSIGLDSLLPSQLDTAAERLPNA